MGGGGVTLQDVHADQLGAIRSTAELVLQEVASLQEKYDQLANRASLGSLERRAGHPPALSPGCESSHGSQQVFSKLGEKKNKRDSFA